MSILKTLIFLHVVLVVQNTSCTKADVWSRPEAIPTPESESNSDSGVGIICSPFWWSRNRSQNRGGVGIGVRIVVIGIGVGIVVIGIGVGIGITWRFHTFMYMVPSNIHSGSKPQETCSNKALSHRVRNTAMWKWLCLFRVDCSAVCISMYSIQACQLILFNNGAQQLDFYFCSIHSKETVGQIGQIWPNSVNSVLWYYKKYCQMVMPLTAHQPTDSNNY